MLSLTLNIRSLASDDGCGLIAFCSDIDRTLVAALERLHRNPAVPHSSKTGSRFIIDRRGARLLIETGGEADSEDDPVSARAIGALAASLALPLRSEEEAARIAEAEGLVTHLTSAASSAADPCLAAWSRSSCEGAD